MTNNLPSYWQSNTELENILEGAEWTATTTAAGLGLALALGASSPLGLAVAGLGFFPPVKQVISYFANRRGRKASIEEFVAIAAPVTYLNSFHEYVNKNSIYQTRLEGKENLEQQVDQRIEDLVLTETLATNVLSNYSQSELVLTFNDVLASLLKKRGWNETEIKITTTWVAWQGGLHLKKEIEQLRTDIPLTLKSIKLYPIQKERNSSHQSIEDYLDREINSKPNDLVFNEEFRFRDIYIPLEAKPVDKEGEVIKTIESFDIENWAKETLLDYKKAKKVMFIQAGAGRGKSFFCRMFASWIQQNFYPLWIPICIRLRDIISFGQSFEKTLQSAVNADFASKEGWLTNSDFRFLFILDGFDELRMEGRAGGGIEKFIQQICLYQESCDTPEMGHRFIVTGRQLALQGVNLLTDKLERVELQILTDELQQKWLAKWQKVVNRDPVIAEEKINSFKKFLKSRNLPQEVKEELAREPLLIYLLAAMHREKAISVAHLSGKSGIQTKITIYEEALDWVLNKQRKSIQQEIVRLDPDELTDVLMEAGLCVTQSGGVCARMGMIRDRLNSDIAKKIKTIQEQDKDEVLKNALAAFYLKQAAGDGKGSVEFFHKSFGEFLCAKRMQLAIEDWIALDRRKKNFNLDDDLLANQIYDVFGYGGLSQEIVQYLFGLLTNSSEFKPEKLFKRLNNFYERWCDGEFIDADGTTFAQAKMRKLKERKPSFLEDKVALGQRQIDVYTGLNVMILLFELHRYGQQKKELKNKINFHPCGDTNAQGELIDDKRLLRIIEISSCLEDNGFLKTVGSFLSGVNFSQVDLSHSNLSKVNFSGANLSKAKLRQTYLIEADLTNANLTEADLCRCDLTNSNLEKAILKNAYLRGADCREAKFINADLEKADLCRAYLYNTNFSHAMFSKVSVKKANLDSANFNNANFLDLIWDVGTQWLNVRGLHQIINIPDKLSTNQDFLDGQRISYALEEIYSGDICKALEIYEKVGNDIAERLQDQEIKAYLYNKAAWLGCLINQNNLCRDKIVDFACQAAKISPQNGNYKDTHGVALAIKVEIEIREKIQNISIVDLPPPNSQSDDDYNIINSNQNNPFKESIKLFEDVLKSEDFKKLALSNIDKIRERRKEWIKKLKLRRSPFDSEMISKLLKEEY